MTKQKIYVIINPISGTGSKESIPTQIAQRVNQHHTELQFFLTGYPGHACEIAQKAVADNAQCVIAVGGDGTVNEVARGLIQSRTALGIIPFGSGNGLARDLHIPLNPDKAIEVATGNNFIREIDYGMANDHVFFCTCGMGFDANVSENFSKEKVRGPLMYIKNVIGTYIDYKPERYDIIYPEGHISEDALLVTCANATQYGNNAVIAPHANLNDGLLNIAILKPFGILDIPQTTIQLFSRNMDRSKYLTEVITSQALIRRRTEGWIHLDGDPVYEKADISIKVVPKGLKVMVPISTNK